MSNEIQRFITQVAEGSHLSQDDAARVFQIMMAGGATPAQMSALLMALRIHGETPDEIIGAARAIRAKMDVVQSPAHTIDVCGTGGDGKGSLNVSTAVALVVAACGVVVAKHGNRSVSSTSGSSDVLSALGVAIQCSKSLTETALREVGFGFMFAPLYHKALRHVAPVRQELGIRTIFNVIGPLVNPALPKRQLLGVYSRELLSPMAETLRGLGSERAWVVAGSDGMDELTLSGVSYIAELKDNTIRIFEITPEDAGLQRNEDPAAMQGKDAQWNARELKAMLGGKPSAYRDVVLLNVAAALMIAEKVTNLAEGVEMARLAIDDGKALKILDSVVEITNRIH